MTADTLQRDRRCYSFGPYVVDAGKRLLWRDRALVPITSKAFEILLFLMQRRGRVVEKQELLEEIWRRTAVEENTLTRHISTLRKILDERPDHHQYVLTIPGHGYQFVAEIVELDERPGYLHHSVAAAPPDLAGEERARSATDSGVMAIPEASTPAVAAPQGASAGPSIPDNTRAMAGSSGSWVALAAGLSLAAVTTALVFAALRVDAPAASIPSRGLRQVTFLGGLQTDPTWSPDGRQVAYASDHHGSSDIYVQPIGASAPRQLTFSPGEDSQPDWSPDGEFIVFRSETDGGGLFVVPSRGGTVRRIASFGFHPRWSPNGALIMFSSSGHRGGVPRFFVVTPRGQTPQPLRPDVFGRLRPTHVAWRPDSNAFSVWGLDAANRWTFVTAPVASGPMVASAIAPAVEQQRQELGLTLERFVWSPSGRHIFFEGQAQETAGLWRMTVDPKTLAWTGGPDRITTGTTQDTNAAVGPEGKRLIFSARNSRTRLWMFPFDAAAGKVTGDGQPVTSGAAGEQDADAPDDGSKLVYRTMRGSKQQVWERSVADGHERLLVEGDEWTLSRPRWSSDGRWLSYQKRRAGTAVAGGDAAVAILSVDRGEESLVTRPGTPSIVPTDWSPDGKWLIGGCPRPETQRVGTCMVDITQSRSEAAAVRVLTADSTFNLFEQRFSPDQKWITFIAVNGSDAGASTVYVMPASGGSWKPITDGSTYDDKPHWSPDGRTIYFVSHRDGVLNVWGRRIDPASGWPSGAPFRVTSFNSPRQMISSQLSRMQIAVTAGRLFLPITDTQSELWMLENIDR